MQLQLLLPLVDPSWEPFVGDATTQIAAAVVVSAILVPIITGWWAKKYGCPKYPLKPQSVKQ